MRASAASEPEFEAVVMRHYAEIHRYVARMANRGGDAEDLSQETFLRAYRAWSGLPRDANHRAWLFAIATNLCRNHARTEQRRSRAHATERVIRSAVETDDPEAEAVAGEMRSLTASAIRILPFKQRTALVLRKLHELDYESIGETLGCSPESARAHVFQALRKLRAVLDTADSSRAGRSTR